MGWADVGNVRYDVLITLAKMDGGRTGWTQEACAAFTCKVGGGQEVRGRYTLHVDTRSATALWLCLLQEVAYKAA